MLLKKWVRQVVFLVSVLLIVIMLENRDAVTTLAPHSENTVKILTAERWESLDPAYAGDAASANIISNIFEGLVKYKANSTEVEPALATDWEIHENGRVWIFHLRKGVKFHDGTPFNAAAVKFSVERVMKGKNTMPYANMAFEMVENIEIMDDYTVKFTLKQAYAPFLQSLAMPWAAPIVSPSAVKGLNDRFAENPVGTGPFCLKDKSENELVLVANKNYWQDPPAVNKVVFIYQPDEKRRLEMLVNGEADIADGISPANIAWAEKNNLKVLKQPAASVNYLGFYANKPPFASARIRRAVTMALDREALAEQLYDKQLAVGESYLPPKVAGYSSKLTQYPYQIDEAKNLLAQNGYPNGMTITLITYQETRPYNPVGGVRLAQGIKEQLAKAGINVQIKAYPWEEYKEALKRQEGNCFLYGWTGDNGDPDNFLATLLTTNQIESGLNIARYSNPQVDRILASAQQVVDGEVREQLYYHAQQIILQEAPWVVLNYGCHIAVSQRNVQKFTLQPIGGYYLQWMKKS